MDENCPNYTLTNKRYLTQSVYLKRRFGEKVVKISLNGGFTCPNKDGSKGFFGCTYCSESGSGDFGGNPMETITSQFESIKEIMSHKWGNSRKFIPYFQANTNTYAPLERLKSLYEEDLGLDGVCGLAISTRPDCITEEVADYLLEISKRTYLTVELGLQTIHDKTAEIINRCHTYKDFFDGYNLLNSRGINICVHIINGLPGESHEMMMGTARAVAGLNIHSIKIHLLHVLRGTPLAESYQRGEFRTLELEEYINIVCDQLEIIPKNVIIQRVTGDGAHADLIAPLWSRKKFVVLNGIDKELERRGSFQGWRG